MANSYCGFSAILPVPEDKRAGLGEYIKGLEEAIINDDGYLGCIVEITDDGVWFTDTDCIGEPEHVAEIAKHLVEALQLPEPFYFNYAYWCDKPRLDEFGGGACVVQLGKDTIWCNPDRELRKQVLAERDAKEYYYTLKGNDKSIGLDGTRAFVWESRVMDMCRISGIYPDEEFVLKIQGDDKTWYEKYTDGTLVMMGRDYDTAICGEVGEEQGTP